jgi:hypothetical protein
MDFSILNAFNETSETFKIFKSYLYIIKQDLNAFKWSQKHLNHWINNKSYNNKEI